MTESDKIVKTNENIVPSSPNPEKKKKSTGKRIIFALIALILGYMNQKEFYKQVKFLLAVAITK